MSLFANAMNKSAYTWNGAVSHASPDISGIYTGRLSLFFKGSRGLSEDRLYDYLKICASENLLDTFILVFNLRACRHGKGERHLGRLGMRWLFLNNPEQFEKVIELIPHYGRWDDLLDLFPGVFNGNNEYLQNKIVKFMGDKLKEDRELMLQGKPVSLCAKWTPTEGDSLDKKHGVFLTLAQSMNVTTKQLRKMYNTPLREYLKVVERYMCQNKWGDIDYNKVPSRAMFLLKDAFVNHDSDRFDEWKKNLESGKTKVNSSMVYPHEFAKELRTKGEISKEVLNAQWKGIIDQVEQMGTMEDYLCVLDRSGSMKHPEYLPWDVATGMGMLISQVTKGLFHGHLITFDSKPEFRVISDGDIQTRYKQIENMGGGLSTNLQATFDLILGQAISHNLRNEDMPKRLFIISDMQFNGIENHRSQTNMDAINEKYRMAGYKRPQIVFWNVNGSSSDFPVTVDERGTAIISGFSPFILKTIMNSRRLDSVYILEQTLNDSNYDLIREKLEDFQFV